MDNPYLQILRQAKLSEDKKRIAALQRELEASQVVLRAAMNFIHEKGLDNKFFEEEIKPLKKGGMDITKFHLYCEKRYKTA